MRDGLLGLPYRFLATYIILGIIAGWLSFYPRPLGVAAAVELQQQVWASLTQGKSYTTESPLVMANSSRILFPLLMRGFEELGVSSEKAFSLLRLISIIFAYTLFHRYLRLWFSDELAFCGTLFMAATIPLAFNNYIEIPTDFIEIIIFTLGLWMIYQQRYHWLYLIVFIGTLNRETAAVLPFFLFFVSFERRRILWLGPVFIAGLCWLLPFIVLRYRAVGNFIAPYGDFAHNSEGLLQLLSNLHPYNNYLFWFYLFGTFWLLPYLGWKCQPRFYKRLLVSVPIFVLVYCLAGGYFDEPRELVNLYPLLVPAGLFALFPSTSLSRIGVGLNDEMSRSDPRMMA